MYKENDTYHSLWCSRPKQALCFIELPPHVSPLSTYVLRLLSSFWALADGLSHRLAFSFRSAHVYARARKFLSELTRPLAVRN